MSLSDYWNEDGKGERGEELPEEGRKQSWCQRIRKTQ